mmetsp:Transcript_8369/g.35497  ORF Transcript_8369/g.35497 Transcript_8369/m.35497 type:complete len:245 (-) Transcript_8369:298-1032(-)
MISVISSATSSVFSTTCASSASSCASGEPGGKFGSGSGAGVGSFAGDSAGVVCSSSCFTGDATRLSGDSRNGDGGGGVFDGVGDALAGESLAGAALAYLATASPELAALDASLCASMAVHRVMLRPTLASCLGTSRLQYRLLPCLTYVVRERRTPHATHLKQPLCMLAPSTSTLSIGYAVLSHTGHAFFCPPNRDDAGSAVGAPFTRRFGGFDRAAEDASVGPSVSVFVWAPAVDRSPSPNASP